MAETKDNFDIVVLNFADSKIPEFKEVRNKDYVLCGADNLYPEYLTYLYNKSAKHGAIINGKSNYILGGGFEKKVPTAGSLSAVKLDGGITLPAKPINKAGETINEVMQKTIKDVEIYGGFKWFISWNALGQVANIVHDDFYKFRAGKDGGFWYKKDWSKTREEATFYKEFNVNDREGTTVFSYNEYRPGCDVYPLPGYVGACNYIDIDIEISKFHLSAIRNGMMPSKMIQFFDGEPTEDKKKVIEKRFKEKFGGAENAGKFILVFGKDPGKAVNISDLSFSELDKQFDLLNKTSEQQIFTGHQVVSPMLFGIKTEGQLGGNTELKTAYEIFINTYAKPKQANLEKIVNYFGSLMGVGNDYYIEQLDPIGIQIDAAAVLTFLPKEFIYDKLNVPQEYRNLPSMNPSAVPAGVTSTELEKEPGAPVNDNIKNLTAKQHQQLTRIIRQVSKGQLTEAAGKALLKSGLGLNDADISSLLGTDEPQQFKSADADEDAVIQMFSACGDDKENYHIVKSKKVKFESDEVAANDELNFFSLAFASEVSDEDVMTLVAKDKRITPEVISASLNITVEAATAKLADLIDRGLLKSSIKKVGTDEQLEHEATGTWKEIPKKKGIEISIKYSYEGPMDSKNRPFCARLMKLARLYTRYEIETISQRLGYSVFDRRGGFWTRKGTDETTPYCRHHWKSNVVVKKRED